MVNNVCLVALCSVVVGCATAGAPHVTAPSHDTAAADAVAPKSAPPIDEDRPDWTVTLQPLAEEGRVRVAIKTTSVDVTHWTLPQPTRALRNVMQRQHSVTYEVAPSKSSPCVFEITPNHAVFCGAAVLPTPDTAAAEHKRHTIEIRMISSDAFYASAASSFGLGSTYFADATYGEVRRAGFLFGDVHDARFDAAEGRDHAAWLGYFSFDPRWVAAEAAGVRTAVDRWLGIRRPEDDPTVGLLFSGTSDTTDTIRMTSLFRGVLIQAGPSANWSVRARLDLTRKLVQRTIGGAVSLDDAGAQWWFDEGIAHGIALRVLLDVGVVNAEEAAHEVSSWLAEDALSVHARASLQAVVTVASRDNQDDATLAARRLLAVRGAQLAIALRGDALQRTARELVKQRAAGATRLPGDAFFSASGGFLEPSRAKALRTAFESGSPLPLRAADLGPCLAMVNRNVHAFRLGFSATSTGTTISAVVAGSPAARAGVQHGDEIVSMDYISGRADVPARLELKRDHTTLKVVFHPRGPSRKARAFKIASRQGTCSNMATE